MVNVYVFRDDGTTPNGWSEISASYRERLPLLGGTVLETGGTDTHGHTVAVSAVAQPTIFAGNAYGAYGSPYRANKLHQHSNAGTATCTQGNHLPSYKNFRLVYRSIAGWDGSVPSGSILFRATVPAGWNRTCDAESFFIRISATAGGTGGGDTHNHSISGQTDNDNSTNSYTSATNQRLPNGNHYHLYSGSSSDAVHNYLHWSCGLVKASSDVFILRDSYALFDGDPGPNWEAVSADGSYLRISSTNSVVAGGSDTTWTHNHGGSASITSNATYTNQCQNISSMSGTLWDNCTHTHAVTITIQNQAAQPSYVRLLLYKSLTDFGNPTTYTVTYDLDVLVARLNVDVPVDADTVLKKLDIPTTADLDSLLKKLDISRSADFDYLSQVRNLSAIYATDAVLKRIADIIWSMSSRLVLRSNEEYNVDALIKRIYGRELIFDLISKKPFEAQAIFDLQTRGTIPKTFTLDALLKKLSLITGLDSDFLLKKVGIGTTYQMDILDKRLNLDSSYALDTEIKATKTFTELVDLLVSKPFSDTYEVDAEFKIVLNLLHAIDVLIQKAFSQSMTADLLSRRTFTSSFSADVEIEITLQVLETVDLLLRKTFGKTLTVDFVSKHSSEASYASDIVTKLISQVHTVADLLSRKSLDQEVSADLILREITSIIYGVDVLIKHFDLENFYDADVEVKLIRDLAEVSDLLIRKAIDQDVSIDTILQKLGITTSHKMGLLNKRLGLDEPYDADVEIHAAKDISEIVDMLIEKGFSKDLPLDLLLQKLGATFSHQMELICKSVREGSYSTDAQVLIAKDLIILADLLVRKAFNEDLPSDLLLQRLGLTVAHQMDLLGKRTGINIAHSLDIEIKIAKDFQVLADLMIKRSFGIDLPTDLAIRKIFPAPYQMDLLSGKAIETHADLDMLLASTFSQTCNVDYRSRVYRAVEWEMSRKLMKYDVDMIYFISGYFRLDVGNRLGYLVNALCFGDDELNFHADIILSDRPTKYRQLRRYPPTSETPAGAVEVHGMSFERVPIEKRPRTYPETKPEHSETEVHPESFDYEPSKRKNRQVKITYR